MQGSPVRRAVVRFSIRSRQKKAAFVEAFVRRHRLKSVLVVGAGGMKMPNAAIVEQAALADARPAVACDLEMHEGVPWLLVMADGRALPFRDASFDLVLSNAVIEHVGTEDHQRVCVAEHVRVGRSWVITTPNRWFPIESHTNAVLRHWSARWRARQTVFTRLLSRREFARLLPTDAVVESGGGLWPATFLAWKAPEGNAPS